MPSVAAGRIDEVIQTESSIQDVKNPEQPGGHNGAVRFDHVNFRYPGAEEDVLHDIDFVAEPGKTTAIIGSTGCGKSTLVNLIPRLYDVTGGKITLDGKDIRNITMKDLRDEIGFVPQKGVLFSGTIASNLRFGKDDATDAEIEKAAAIAQATEFIEEKMTNTKPRLHRAERTYPADRNSVWRLRVRLQKTRKSLFSTTVFLHLT